MTQTMTVIETKEQTMIDTYQNFYSSNGFAALQNELEGFQNLTEYHEAEINK